MLKFDPFAFFFPHPPRSIQWIIGDRLKCTLTKLSPMEYFRIALAERKRAFDDKTHTNADNAKTDGELREPEKLSNANNGPLVWCRCEQCPMNRRTMDRQTRWMCFCILPHIPNLPNQRIRSPNALIHAIHIDSIALSMAQLSAVVCDYQWVSMIHYPKAKHYLMPKKASERTPKDRSFG